MLNCAAAAIAYDDREKRCIGRRGEKTKFSHNLSKWTLLFPKGIQMETLCIVSLTQSDSKTLIFPLTTTLCDICTTLKFFASKELRRGENNLNHRLPLKSISTKSLEAV